MAQVAQVKADLVVVELQPNKRVAVDGLRSKKHLLRPSHLQVERVQLSPIRHRLLTDSRLDNQLSSQV
jgi:hypothetical protein